MTTNFLGIPVNGDITRGSDRVEQKPIEELQPILQAVLDDPSIVEFGWRQYTPYFNDGEPCEFGVHAPWFRTDNDRDAEDEYDLEIGYNHPSLGKRPKTWDSSAKDWVYQAYEGPDEARYDRCLALSRAIEGGHFPGRHRARPTTPNGRARTPTPARGALDEGLQARHPPHR